MAKDHDISLLTPQGAVADRTDRVERGVQHLPGARAMDRSKARNDGLCRTGSKNTKGCAWFERVTRHDFLSNARHCADWNRNG
jgi:hypothetical protein